MIDSYFMIYHMLDQVDIHLVDFIPSPPENVRLKPLHDDLRNVESINKHRNGVNKLLTGKAANLSRQERTAVANTTGETPPKSDDPSPKKRSFAEKVLGSEVPPSTAPHSLHWSPPTSNDVERLFSRAGIVYWRLRRSLNPPTLETVIFL
ncbi:LOW QUALITY PROTEIN: hypothetical protein PHMEG_00021237 [Phytophthora megakarya]|uniref:HAT C-terminal dimerisation domain-containing protein n=1 Tax=Phytophthora megakarya TaxID=4795 RepID=A0A225VLQ7_9STRA|nr:LOW QUALITY PROTEIN: hypothetical protein PHMEG_00021237 [Phytophthora megakarya]